MTPPSETIVAIATPPGRGGIGIVRLSGPEAVSVALPLLRLQAPLAPRRACFSEIIDPGEAEPQNKLDEAVVTWFEAPHSYTGEHVLEIAAHGAPVLLEFLLQQCVARGARLANPGEFTERAFLSGRLDLTQAEAVRDLIEAQTLYQARVAASQMDGALSRRVAPVKAELIALIAQLEAGIDFAEDDTPTLSPLEIAARAEPIGVALAQLARSFEHGRLIHGGFTLALVGAPNVGKSSLFNALVEQDRAIVTSVPGTTRDLVTERIALAGLPLELVDTAGIRDVSGDAHEPLAEAEQIGIRKSRQAQADADLILLVLDAARALETAIFPLVRARGSSGTPAPFSSLEGRRVIAVLNKADLLAATPPDTQQLQLQVQGVPAQTPIVLTSALTGLGVAELRTAIAASLHAPEAAEQSGMLTNLRQHQSVVAARQAIESALEAATTQTPHEMLLLDLYAALAALDTLTGATTPDDVLNLIFSTFCIGK